MKLISNFSWKATTQTETICQNKIKYMQKELLKEREVIKRSENLNFTF